MNDIHNKHKEMSQYYHLCKKYKIMCPTICKNIKKWKQKGSTHEYWQYTHDRLTIQLYGGYLPKDIEKIVDYYVYSMIAIEQFKPFVNKIKFHLFPIRSDLHERIYWLNYIHSDEFELLDIGDQIHIKQLWGLKSRMVPIYERMRTLQLKQYLQCATNYVYEKKGIKWY